VLVYEDLCTGLRAKVVLEWVEHLFPGAPLFNLAMWRFDLLSKSTVREAALHETCAALIVLLSAHGGRKLPKGVKAWFEQWIKRKSDDPCALVISLDESSRDCDSATQMISLLQARAKETDISVFPHFSQTPRREGDLTLDGTEKRVQAKTAMLNDLQRWSESCQHWGINE
jgi:hypothetical protein